MKPQNRAGAIDESLAAPATSSMSHPRTNTTPQNNGVRLHDFVESNRAGTVSAQKRDRYSGNQRDHGGHGELFSAALLRLENDMTRFSGPEFDDDWMTTPISVCESQADLDCDEVFAGDCCCGGGRCGGDDNDDGRDGWNGDDSEDDDCDDWDGDDPEDEGYDVWNGDDYGYDEWDEPGMEGAIRIDARDLLEPRTEMNWDDYDDDYELPIRRRRRATDPGPEDDDCECDWN